MQTSYTSPRIPMYHATRVTSNGNLIFTEYKTRAEVSELMLDNKLSPVMENGDYLTNLYFCENGDRLIITTTYIQHAFTLDPTNN